MATGWGQTLENGTLEDKIHQVRATLLQKYIQSYQVRGFTFKEYTTMEINWERTSGSPELAGTK
jgi:hypothetical protein